MGWNMTGTIIGIVLGAMILTYTGYVVYKKMKDLKEGKSCCGGGSSCTSCDHCSSKEKCNLK